MFIWNVKSLIAVPQAHNHLKESCTPVDVALWSENETQKTDRCTSECLTLFYEYDVRLQLLIFPRVQHIWIKGRMKTITKWRREILIILTIGPFPAYISGAPPLWFISEEIIQKTSPKNLGLVLKNMDSTYLSL